MTDLDRTEQLLAYVGVEAASLCNAMVVARRRKSPPGGVKRY